MKKRIIILPLLLTGSVLSQTDKKEMSTKIGQKHRDPFDQVFADMRENFRRIDQEFERRFDAIEKNMFVQFDQIKDEVSKEANKTEKPQEKLTDISVKDNFVVVKLHLGELNAKDINIDASDDELKATIPLAGGSATFGIQSGNMFSLSVHHESKADKKSGETESKAVSYADSTKIESLPMTVQHLENTQVTYKNGIVELKMPTVPAKKGTKINVVTQ